VKRWLHGVGLYIEGIVFVIFAIFCENDSSSLLLRCSVLTPISGSTRRKSNKALTVSLAVPSIAQEKNG
jgi:hypothetical protein